MKKLIALILAVLMILSFAACDKNEPDEPSNSSGTPSASNTPAESTGDPSNTDTPTNTDTPSNTDTPTNTDTPDETDGPDETDAPSNTDKPAPDDTPMAGFVINTRVYTTKYEDGKDVHLEGLDSGIYREPDRSTSCGSLKDGTEVQVLEVGFEGDDITVGWAKILVSTSKAQVYIRTSQLKCFVLHEVGAPVSPEELIGKSALVSRLPDVEKKTIEASFLALGYRTAFMEDGSTMFISNENFEDQLIQNADGSWTEYDGEGGVNQYFDSWQYELLTEYGIPTDRDVAEMKIALLGISSVEGVAVSFAPSVTLENVKAYAEKLKALGYTLYPSQAGNDKEYFYIATNQNGYSVQITYTGGQGAMIVKKTVNTSFDLTAFIQSGDIMASYPSEKLDEFQRMIEANGGRLEHKSKSIILIFPDGTAEQFYDGSWHLKTEAVESTTGGYFPPNEFTAQLMSVDPSIYGFKNGDTVLYKQEKVFMATFTEATVDKAKAFTSALVMRGAFNMNITETEAENEGVKTYYFYAETYNYAIEFSCIDGQTAAMKIVDIQQKDA